MNKIFEKLMSLQEAADSIGVSADYLRAEIKRGKLKENEDVKKYGRDWIVVKANFIDKYSKKLDSQV